MVLMGGRKVLRGLFSFGRLEPIACALALCASHGKHLSSLAIPGES